MAEKVAVGSLEELDRLMSWAQTRRQAEIEQRAQEEARRRKDLEVEREEIFEEMIAFLDTVGEALRPWVAKKDLRPNKVLQVEVRLPDTARFDLSFQNKAYFGTSRVTFTGNGHSVTIAERTEEEWVLVGQILASLRATYARRVEEEKARDEHHRKVAAFEEGMEKWKRVCGKVMERNARLLGEIQASVDVPYSLWELEYAVLHDELGSIEVDVRTMAVLHDELGDYRWCNEVLMNGQVRRVKVFAPVRRWYGGALLPSGGRYARVVRTPLGGADIHMAPGTADEELEEIGELARKVCWELPAMPEPEAFGLTGGDVWQIMDRYLEMRF